ncbi:MAG: SpoIIE family protein phosphatase [Planctomycetota bacterium]|jgi:serine phosphatase RsbU (regulator of sigma subunit)/pSer/pThr/pTyr-binding forkhead associated (FHA) protein
MAVLRAMQGLNPGQLFPLERESSILGRHPDCDIVLESGAVSRQHARVTCAAGEYYVEDLGSRNGTFVNGRAIVDRQLLTDGDQLGICELLFSFHASAADPDLLFEEDRLRTIGETATMVDDGRPTPSSTIMSKVDVSSGSSGLRLEVNPKAKLKALIEIGRNLGKALGLGEVLPKLLDSLFAIFVQADRGFIVLKDPATDRLIPKAVKYRRDQDEERARISRTVVNSVMNGKEAILSADATSDARFDMAESIVDFHIRSMMCAPLIDSEGKALGVIQIDTLDQRSRFNREDLDVLASVACQAAVAVENAQLHEAALRERVRARELAIAYEVQRGFLPATQPQIDQYEFFDFYDPARELGGDYYDYVQLADGRLAVVVADVSGKGAPAALLMARLSAETRFCLASEPTPAEAIGRLNRVFSGAVWEGRFVTLVLAVLDPARHEVAIVNAGHLPPLLRRPSSGGVGTGRCEGGATVEAIAEPETRFPLGVDEDVVYAQHTLVRAPGDCLTLYTDGITEAMNDASDLYGRARLRAQLASDVQRVGVIGRGILDDVRQFVGTRAQSDDMCLTCFGRCEAGSG